MSLIIRTPAPLAPAPNMAIDRALAGLLSDHSRRAYAADFRDLARWLHPDSEALTLEDLRGLTVEALANYRDELRRGRGLATGTVNRRISAIRKLLQAAVDRGVRADNPAKAVRGYKSSYKETPALTEDEARRLIAQPDRATLLGLRDYAILQIAVRLGLRRRLVGVLTGGLDRPPYTLGRAGHRDVVDAEGTQSVHNGVDNRRSGGDGAGLPDSLGAQGVARRR